jgi:hypothetical protein
MGKFNNQNDPAPRATPDEIKIPGSVPKGVTSPFFGGRRTRKQEIMRNPRGTTGGTRPETQQTEFEHTERSFKTFSDFLEAKKQDLIDAKDGLAGEDYDGPLSVKPPQAPTKGKNDKAQPYKASGEVKNGVVYTAADDGAKKGFAYDASPGMTPQTSMPMGKSIEDKSQQIKVKKKLTTEEFIESTKEMDDSQFANFILESHDRTLSTVTDLFGNEYTPDPTQAIQYVAGLLMGNHTFMERFIREMKRRDGLNSLVTELFEHGDTYEKIVEQLDEPEFGLDRCSKFARTMNDHYMKAFDNLDFGKEEDLGESVSPKVDELFGMKPQGQAPAMPGAMPATPGAPAAGGGNEDPYAGGIYARNPKANPMGAQAVRNPSNANAGVMGGEQNPNFGGQPVMPPKKMSDGADPTLRQSAGLHLINEMSGFPHFRKHMAKRCIDC